jgi:hypothetical protein
VTESSRTGRRKGGKEPLNPGNPRTGWASVDISGRRIRAGVAGVAGVEGVGPALAGYWAGSFDFTSMVSSLQGRGEPPYVQGELQTFCKPTL